MTLAHGNPVLLGRESVPFQSDFESGLVHTDKPDRLAPTFVTSHLYTLPSRAAAKEEKIFMCTDLVAGATTPTECLLDG